MELHFYDEWTRWKSTIQDMKDSWVVIQKDHSMFMLKNISKVIQNFIPFELYPKMSGTPSPCT